MPDETISGMGVHHWEWNDKLAVALVCIAALMTLPWLWMDKTPVWAGSTIACMVLLTLYPAIHFMTKWRWRICTLLLAWLMIGYFGWKIWPHKLPDLRQAAPSSAPVPRPFVHQNPSHETQVTSTKSASHQNADRRQHEPLKLMPSPTAVLPSQSTMQGDDNTIVGKVPYGSLNGSRNTIVGATDENGNTVMNQGGTTIGAGACGCPTCVVIGANAGCQKPTNPVTANPKTD